MRGGQPLTLSEVQQNPLRNRGLSFGLLLPSHTLPDTDDVMKGLRLLDLP